MKNVNLASNLVIKLGDEIY